MSETPKADKAAKTPETPKTAGTAKTAGKQSGAKTPPRKKARFDEARQRRVNEVPFWKLCLLFPLSVLLRIWLSTLRMRIAPEARRAVREDKNPLIFVLWHNRLIIAAELHRRFRGWSKVNGLVSPSHDGAWLAAFFKMLGIGAVRGSTGRRGGQAMFEIHKKLQHGEDVAITPDGPRGPRYKFNPGAALLAQVTHCTVVAVGAKFHCAKQLGSWDGFYVPLPFSRVDIVPKFLPYDAAWEGVPARELAEKFGNALASVNED